MKLKCPACGTPIPSENINVRTMTAVCSNCDNVFTFKSVDAGLTRKLKAPEQFTHHDESDHAPHFSFKWSWRTEPRFSMIVLSLMFIGGLALFAGGLAEGLTVELIIPLLVMAVPAIVFIALKLNSTHYQIDGDQLRIYTTPLWFPYYGRRTIPVWEIIRLTTERAFSPPGASARDSFYNVYAHTVDGDQIMVARLVNYEHAHYIAQEIQAFVDNHQDTTESYFNLTSQSNLTDQPFLDDTELIDDDSEQQQHHHR